MVVTMRFRLIVAVAATAVLANVLTFVGNAAAAESSRQAAVASPILSAVGVASGLLVQVGCGDAALPSAAARTGHFLVQVLEADAAQVEQLRSHLSADGAYGLASADRLADRHRLPYTENLVNLLILGKDARCSITLAEARRVLCPRGVLVVASERTSKAALAGAGFEEVGTLEAGGSWLVGRKPWPKEMDQWPQARHGADGNAVSHDTLVAPPRRIRWVAGPPREINNMVSSGGRNFYGGVWARDSFNGLKLWEQSLTPSPARGGFVYRAVRGSVRPVAVGDSLFVVTDGNVMELDGATGSLLRDYPAAGSPGDLLYDQGLLLAVDNQSVRAVETPTGRLHWNYAAADPQCTIAAGGSVYFVQGDIRRGEDRVVVCLDLETGKVRWRLADLPWIAKVRRLVCDEDVLVCEVSTITEERAGNGIQVLSASDGRPLWSREYVPGLNHFQQARALIDDGLVWAQERGEFVGLDRRTGTVQKTYPAGKGHCFPPVGTTRFLFAGEMQLTDVVSGQLDYNPITKGACGRDAGFVPANGLIYTAPKHCVCWPMLRDYSALAGQSSESQRAAAGADDGRPVIERGQGQLPAAGGNTAEEDAWACYRHDAWRSGSTSGELPVPLRVAWSVPLGDWPQGTIADDWRQDSFIRGPVTPPVVARGTVYVARPDAHQIVALDARSGKRRWSFTANGRIDTAPTIHRGLCLFGAKSGFVYCLRADDGQLVWRLRAAPRDERIVAYGQLESPWPVPGSVLVVDDVAYFAAGRQSLADGGIEVFAVEPASGKVLWRQRLDQKMSGTGGGGRALEFDNFDLFEREGDAVSMSRWQFDRRTGEFTCDPESGFAHLTTGGGGVMAPRGFWSYAPRNETELRKEHPYLRPLVVFRDDTLFGCLEDRLVVFRRDFHLDGGEEFDSKWFDKKEPYKQVRSGGEGWRNDRLAHSATWKVEPLSNQEPIQAMLLASNALYLAGKQGTLAVLDPADGRLLDEIKTPGVVWDGLAAAGDRLFLSAQDGQVLCLTKR